jgi:hypothetical protein
LGCHCANFGICIRECTRKTGDGVWLVPATESKGRKGPFLGLRVVQSRNEVQCQWVNGFGHLTDLVYQYIGRSDRT